MHTGRVPVDVARGNVHAHAAGAAELDAASSSSPHVPSNGSLPEPISKFSDVHRSGHTPVRASMAVNRLS